jgi:hypothetical protein
VTAAPRLDRPLTWQGHVFCANTQVKRLKSDRDQHNVCRRGGYRGQARGGHEEVLEALSRYLAGLIVGEGVKEVAVVGDLVAVDVIEHGELAVHSGGGGRGREPPAEAAVTPAADTAA